MVNEQILLILVGAVIGFFFSLLATVTTTLLNHWLSNRTKYRDKLSEARNLHGHLITLTQVRLKNERNRQMMQERLEEIYKSLDEGRIEDLDSSLGQLQELVSYYQKLPQLLEGDEEPSDDTPQN